MEQLNWGICGTGWIAKEMAEAFAKENRVIYGVTSGKKTNAERFARTYGVTQVFDSWNDLVTDPQIDVVYIAVPHNLHYEIMKEALMAGKHVFCEKAITVNSDQLEECVQIAKEKGLVICDGVTLFHMPLYRRLKEIIQQGKLGKIKMIQANFGSCKENDPTNRFFSKELAGGALLDIGVYAVSFARWFLAEQPDVVLSTAALYETGVDETSGILLKNKQGQMAVLSLTMLAKQPKRGIVAGEKGYIEVEAYPRADKARIVWTHDGHVEEIECGKEEDALVYELRDMEQYILTKSGEENLQMIRDVMSILTNVRRQ